MSRQDKPHDSNSRNSKPGRLCGVAQATSRIVEMRQRLLLNLTGRTLFANTPGLTSHYLLQEMSCQLRLAISGNNGSKCLGKLVSLTPVIFLVRRRHTET